MRYLSLTFLVLAFTSCAFISHEEVELAPYMGSLQRFSQKLGYAAEAKNEELVEFYLHEIEETLDELEATVPEHEGLPIAKPIRVIMFPLIEALEEAAHNSDWKKASTGYKDLIDGCNRCHAATEHEFIKITPASGGSPYNQKF